jgi:hypothetical protein
MVMMRVQLLLPFLALSLSGILRETTSFSCCWWNHPSRSSPGRAAAPSRRTFLLRSRADGRTVANDRRATSAPMGGVSATTSSRLLSSPTPNGGGGDKGGWRGEVVPQGTIRGCSITPVGEAEPYTEWTVAIDGIEADLGRFSEAIYKQITADAKKQRFQGFRPGTVPPHLQPTYRAFTMDECARETVLEAMQQNDIRPFTDARTNFRIEHVSIPPSATSPARESGNPKKGRKGKKNAKKASGNLDDVEEAGAIGPILLQADDKDPDQEPAVDSIVQQQQEWRKFKTLDEAIKAGWKPGQSFSFIATNVKGQRLLKQKNVDGARPLGFK